MDVRVVERAGARARIDAIVDRVLANVAEDIASDARQLAPSDTGALRASIQAGPASGGEVRVWVGTDHWQFPEFGTAAHDITPRSKQALSWPGGSHPTKRVRHPGTPAVAFMRRATYKRRALRGV